MGPDTTVRDKSAGKSQICPTDCINHEEYHSHTSLISHEMSLARSGAWSKPPGNLHALSNSWRGLMWIHQGRLDSQLTPPTDLNTQNDVGMWYVSWIFSFIYASLVWFSSYLKSKAHEPYSIPNCTLIVSGLDWTWLFAVREEKQDIETDGVKEAFAYSCIIVRLYQTAAVTSLSLSSLRPLIGVQHSTSAWFSFGSFTSSNKSRNVS